MGVDVEDYDEAHILTSRQLGGVNDFSAGFGVVLAVGIVECLVEAFFIPSGYAGGVCGVARGARGGVLVGAEAGSALCAGAWCVAACAAAGGCFAGCEDPGDFFGFGGCGQGFGEFGGDPAGDGVDFAAVDEAHAGPVGSSSGVSDLEVCAEGCRCGVGGDEG